MLEANAPAGGGDEPTLLQRWERVHVRAEVARWSREPPSDFDMMLWGPYKDWSFVRLFDMRPHYVRWLLTNTDPETCTQQQRRFWTYVAGRVAVLEARFGVEAAAGQAQDGGGTAPGEASAPGGGGSIEDGGLPLMALQDGMAEGDPAGPALKDEEEGSDMDLSAPGEVEAGHSAVS